MIKFTSDLLPKNAKVRGPRWLNSSDLDWQGVRFLDPLGKVFRYSNRFIRAINPHKVPYLEHLFATGALQVLSDLDLTCQFSQVYDLHVDGFDMLVEQEACLFKLKADQWTFLQFLDAANCWLDINLHLFSYGLGLNDAHLANFGIYADSKPKWFDLGSVVQISHPHHGFEEFKKYLLAPLMLFVVDAQFSDLARIVSVKGGLTFDLMKHLGVENLKIPEQRRDALMFFKRLIQQFNVNRNGTMWSDYQSQERIFRGFESLSDVRDVFLFKLLKEFKPRSLVDIGCNAGFFSQMALALGAKVLALDLDEASLERFYSKLNAENEKLPVAIGVCSALQKNDFDENRCDLAIAMAITHHLSISQKYPFPAIAGSFSTYTNKDLITEFMPNGLSGAQSPREGSLPSWYNLNNFAHAFAKYFEDVEVVEYDRKQGAAKRFLVVCRGKK
jgi:hypothetical protein